VIQSGKCGDEAMEDFQKSLETSEKSLTMSKELGRISTQIESLTIVVKSLEKLGLENQEQKSELEELINLHGIEADPD
jgi:DNA replication protein DnaD